MENKTPQDIEKYKENYSESKLWDKVKSVAKKAGVKTTYIVLLLFYILKSPDVTKEDKAKICGALGYFILPLDLVPDAVPMFGFADDLSALAWALHTVWKNITPEIKSKAAAKTREWFGDFDQAAADDQLG